MAGQDLTEIRELQELPETRRYWEPWSATSWGDTTHKEEDTTTYKFGSGVTAFLKIILLGVIIPRFMLSSGNWVTCYRRGNRNGQTEFTFLSVTFTLEKVSLGMVQIHLFSYKKGIK